MKKRAYSLTKKERKALQEQEKTRLSKRNRKADEKNAASSTFTETPDSTETVEGSAAAKKPSDVKRIAIAVAVVLVAVVMITAAILIPILLNTVYRYRNINNPVARVELSNGMVLEYEIFEETCPTAATNFIFLAKIGYFDGTIIFDNQNGWMRFGEYEAENVNRSTNTAFTSKIRGVGESYNGSKIPDNRKFNYRLAADTSADAKRVGERGVLTFLYGDFATAFQVASVEGASLNVPTASNRAYSAVACGRAFDSSLENIDKIVAMANNADSPNSVWRAPLPVIKIKKVKMYNLDKSKWRNFVFDDFFLKGNRITNWIG